MSNPLFIGILLPSYKATKILKHIIIYDLRIYDLRIYDLRIYDLRIYDLRIYDLRIYHLQFTDLPFAICRAKVRIFHDPCNDYLYFFQK